MNRLARALRWVADYLDGGDYYCEHWSAVRLPNGTQYVVWSDELPIPGKNAGQPLYSRKDEQHLRDKETVVWQP